MSTPRFSEAVTLFQAGQAVAAGRLCREILAREPAHADSLHLLGVIALQAGDAKTAADEIARAIAANPGAAAYHANLAFALTQLGRAVDAAAAAERAIALNPGAPEAHNNLGVALQTLGRREDAAAAFRQAATLFPGYADAHNNLGSVLLELGRAEAAIAAIRAAIAANPGHAGAHNNLGAALQARGKLDDALASYRTAATLNPNYAAARFNIGNALQRKNQLGAAADAYRQALALDPGYAAAHVDLARVLFRWGRIAEAAVHLEDAIARAPAMAQAHSNLLYAHCFADGVDQAAQLARARRFARLACPAPVPMPRRNGLVPIGPKPNLGIISAEVGSHAVSRFLASFLRHRDRTRFSVTLYETRVHAEAMRGDMLALADRARDLTHLDDDAARATIIGDGIDILIDTSGHLADNRLPLLARRCAPVQAHYIGYHGTTGIEAMDYFIGDGEVAPPAFQPAFTEKLVQLPRLWVAFDPPDNAPEPAPAQGPITFGCFNILTKAGPATLDLWGRVLARVPDSRLVLKYLDNADPNVQARVLAGLAPHGVTPERVTFLDWVPDWRAHMALYNGIHIALDTTPLNSGTTAFDALYMATPLVALRGDWMGGRMSSAMLKALGRPRWIAETADTFVDIAVRLAEDRAGLAARKRSLRAEMLASPLCDGRSLARALEDALGQMAATHNADPR